MPANAWLENLITHSSTHSRTQILTALAQAGKPKLCDNMLPVTHGATLLIK
jgi:hypothetical protein